MELKNKIVVCVTGSSGFIGSWIVKLLLQRGYTVVGTVRDPDDSTRVGHLKSFPGASDRLTLVKADLLDYTSLAQAVYGCNAVIHTACPCPEASTTTIHDPESQLICPSVDGTLNVLNAAASSPSTRVVVMTSSVGAMYLVPNKRSFPLDESCWSDHDYLRSIGEWYCLSKTIAEQKAWDFARDKPGLRLVSINPAVVLGPLLQSKMNASSTHILKYLLGSVRTYANRCQAYVDVRDVAIAHILAFENQDAEGRYFLAESAVHRGDIVQLLAEMYPKYPLPMLCSGPGDNRPREVPYQFSNQKARQLGVQFLGLKQCLRDSVESFKEKGFLPPASPVSPK